MELDSNEGYNSDISFDSSVKFRPSTAKFSPKNATSVDLEKGSLINKNPIDAKSGCYLNLYF